MIWKFEQKNENNYEKIIWEALLYFNSIFWNLHYLDHWHWQVSKIKKL